MADTQRTTELVADIRQGDVKAADALLPLVYEELRTLARRLLRHERSDHTLQATALVHEAYMKLVDQRQADLTDEAHFFAVAATAMRRVLIDAARARNRIKRGGDHRRISLDTDLLGDDDRAIDVLELNDALTKLQEKDPRAGRIVELRFFAGMTIEQAANALGVSHSTVERDWAYARAWLFKELCGNDGKKDALDVGNIQ